MIDYQDILERIPEKPKWWDEHGVPRYCDFSPEAIVGYAKACCLFLVTCQRCGEEFHVSAYEHQYDGVNASGTPMKPGPSLAELIEKHELHYGDPPMVLEGCCNGGWTMNSVPVRVLEFWRRGPGNREWERVSEYEVDITPDWWLDP